MTEPPWLLRARQDLKVNTREVPGDGISPFIAQLYRDLRLAVVDDGVYPWCAVYTSATLVRSGVKPARRVRAARGYLDWGQTSEARPGAVCVLRRGDPSDHVHGHVGFFTHLDDTGRVWLISGNSRNQVAAAAYDPSRILSYRWPNPSDFIASEVVT